MIDLIKKSFEIVGKSNKKKILLLIFFSFFVVILELFTLGILVKVLEAVSNGGEGSNSSLFFNLGNNYKEKNYIYLVVGIFFAFYILKAITIVTFYFKQYKFTYDLKAELTSKVFNYYLFSQYSFFLKNNTDKLIRNLTHEVSLVSTGIIHQLITIGSELLIVFSILLFLLIKYPSILLIIIFVFIVVSIIYFISTKKKIENLGNIRQTISTEIIKKTINGLFGIKDIKILGKEGYFSKIFKESSYKVSKVNQTISIYAQYPKIILEISLIVLIAVIVLKINNIPELIQVGGLILFGGLRLIPSISKILVSLQSIKYHKPAMKVVYDILIDLEEDSKFDGNIDVEKNIKFKNHIQFKNVNYGYEKDKIIFENLNFNIDKGDKIGIFGGSGQGKSTFIDLIVSLLKPTSGKILIDDKILDSSNELNWRRKIGYVPHKVYITNDSLKKNIALGVNEQNIDTDKIKEIIKKTNLTNFRTVKDQNDIMDTKLSDRGLNISGGELQRIALARSLYIDSELLILDEATNSLDKKNKKILIENIFDLFRDKTIIFISHEENDFIFCNKIYELKNNKFKQTK